MASVSVDIVRRPIGRMGDSPYFEFDGSRGNDSSLVLINIRASLTSDLRKLDLAQRTSGTRQLNRAAHERDPQSELSAIMREEATSLMFTMRLLSTTMTEP